MPHTLLDGYQQSNWIYILEQSYLKSSIYIASYKEVQTKRGSTKLSNVHVIPHIQSTVKHTRNFILTIIFNPYKNNSIKIPKKKTLLSW